MNKIKLVKVNYGLKQQDELKHKSLSQAIFSNCEKVQEKQNMVAKTSRDTIQQTEADPSFRTSERNTKFKS